jgi:hypothetical protein
MMAPAIDAVLGLQGWAEPQARLRLSTRYGETFSLAKHEARKA